jgi:hypothetical protein
MAQSFDPFEQAGRSRRLAHDSTDTNLRDRLPSSPMNTLRATAMAFSASAMVRGTTTPKGII